MSLDNKNSELKLRGIPVSEGVSRGRVVVLNRHRIVPAKTNFESLNPEAEEARFLAALDKTRQQILEIQKRLHDKIGAKQSLIFDAHLLVLEYTLLHNNTAMIESYVSWQYLIQI